MKDRAVRSLALVSALLSFTSLPATHVAAQQLLRGAENALVKPTPPAASAPTAVPTLIPYSGSGTGADGKPITGEVPVTFLIYKDEAGGEPVFTETQVAAFDPAGHYEVQLGATLSSGMPINLFGSGEARWIEVQIAGAKIAPRVLLASVPYALKAGDASTLGGLPASAYALAGSGKTQAATSTAPVSDGVGLFANVTTTGGTSGYLPVFNGHASVVNSFLFQGSSGIGIGVTPGIRYKLDVNGTALIRNGIEGVSASGIGVRGIAGTVNTSGLLGVAGAWGDSNHHIGVLGTSTQNSGVQGMSATTYGVQGTTAGVDNDGLNNVSPSAGVYGASSNNAPGILATSTLGDGGDFFAGGSGNGIQAYGGGTVSNYTQGNGGFFIGGYTEVDTSPGGSGVYARGGDDASPDGKVAGDGVLGTGGYSYNGGTGGDGGHFIGGGSDYADGGYGIYATGGSSSGGGVTIAAYFDGYVDVNGTVNSDIASFQIDHPADPANKYLTHASIESSEMVNLYSGNVITDAQGLATVQLPGWFQVLNGDLRYQLTTIGKKAQAWISAEVDHNQFQIASDAANVKVSWQVTGVRQDAYAKAHPMVVEQQKDARERGLYKHPELYGQPVQKSIEWARHAAVMRSTQLAAKNRQPQPSK